MKYDSVNGSWKQKEDNAKQVQKKTMTDADCVLFWHYYSLTVLLISIWPSSHSCNGFNWNLTMTVQWLSWQIGIIIWRCWGSCHACRMHDGKRFRSSICKPGNFSKIKKCSSVMQWLYKLHMNIILCAEMIIAKSGKTPIQPILPCRHEHILQNKMVMKKEAPGSIPSRTAWIFSTSPSRCQCFLLTGKTRIVLIDVFVTVRMSLLGNQNGLMRNWTKAETVVCVKKWPGFQQNSNLGQLFWSFGPHQQGAESC